MSDGDKYKYPNNPTPGWQLDQDAVFVQAHPSGSPNQDGNEGGAEASTIAGGTDIDPIAEVAAAWIRLSRWLKSYAKDAGLETDELKDAEIIQLLHREGRISKEAQTNLHALRYERVQVEHNDLTPSREDAISFANRVDRTRNQILVEGGQTA